MKKGKDLVPIVLFLGAAALLACSRVWVLPTVSRSESRTWCWGGDPQRTGQNPESMAPPLELRWLTRLSSVPGAAISAAGGTLFVGTQDGRIVMLRASNGKTEKTIKIDDRVEVTCAVRDSLLVTASRWGKPSLRGFRLLNGARIWKADAGPIESEPLLLRGKIAVGNDRSEAMVFNAATGKRIWRVLLDSPVRGNAAVSPDSVLYTTERGTLFCLSAGDGKMLWKTPLVGTVGCGPVVADGKALIGTERGVFYAIGTTDGKEAWRFRSEGGIFLSAASDGKAAYLGTSQGILYCLDCKTGTERWRFVTGSVIGTTPLISGDWIYFGALDKCLYAVNRKTGREGWRSLLKGRVQTSPVIWNGMLFTGSEQNAVYGFYPMD